MAYVTRRQRKEQRKKRAGWIAAIIVILLVICVVAAVVLRFGIHKNTKPVSTGQAGGSQSWVDFDPAKIPDYSGQDVIDLNGGLPGFNTWDMENISGENYSELDSLGRCGTAYAMLDRSMMPTEKRGEIGHIKPTGWVQEKYEGVVDAEPPYLYNRSHLIAYALTGQNDNELNLITGTRYMNATTMLPYEEEVMRCLDNSDNHVLYRISPYFKDDELLARGVEMEAYSVEDEGEGVCYHVFVYNVQPGIIIDYSTGENKAEVNNGLLH